MLFSTRACLLTFISFCFILSPFDAWSASPIKAKAVLIEGRATLFSIVDSKAHDIVLGMEFREGDRVKTSKNGVVEIEFDTGDLIRIDKNSDMVIKALHRSKAGSTTSIFSLLVGRVKSAVTKLVDKKSKFEYHTRAAIAGVAGTPPFIVGFVGGIASVDLLGKTGDEGKVFVQGTDNLKSKIDILPGFRTTVSPGFAPKNPFRISTQRRSNLNRTIPFINKPKKKKVSTPRGGQGQKQDEGQPGDKPGQEGGADVKEPGEPPSPVGALPPVSVEEHMVINTLNRTVSKPRQATPENVDSVEAVESQTTGEQGIIGQTTESTGDDKPPVNTTTIDIFIKLK